MAFRKNFLRNFAQRTLLRKLSILNQRKETVGIALIFRELLASLFLLYHFTSSFLCRRFVPSDVVVVSSFDCCILVSHTFQLVVCFVSARRKKAQKTLPNTISAKEKEKFPPSSPRFAGKLRGFLAQHQVRRCLCAHVKATLSPIWVTLLVLSLLRLY